MQNHAKRIGEFSVLNVWSDVSITSSEKLSEILRSTVKIEKWPKLYDILFSAFKNISASFQSHSCVFQQDGDFRVVLNSHIDLLEQEKLRRYDRCRWLGKDCSNQPRIILPGQASKSSWTGELDFLCNSEFKSLYKCCNFWRYTTVLFSIFVLCYLKTSIFDSDQ